MDQTPNSQSAKRNREDTSPNSADNGSAVGTLSVKDLMSLMSSLMDEKLINIPTKKDIEDIKTNVGELSTKFDGLKLENEYLKKEVTELKFEREKDHQQINYLQEHIKRNNIIFKGIEAKTTLEDAVKDCCKENLKLTQDINLLSTRKMYEKDGKIGVVAEFSSGEMVKEVFQNTKNLAGSKIIVERDLTHEKQQDKRVMLEIKKKLKKINQNTRVMVRSARIKIGENWFWWNKQKKFVSGTNNVNMLLKTLYGEGINSVNFNYYEILNNLSSKNF